MRQVRGVLFLDYVRMLRTQKTPMLARHLAETDHAYLTMQIDRDGWYPMEVFERLGGAILEIIAHGQLFPVQLWGRYSATKLHEANPMLLAPDDPIETINRFRVLRETFFNFPALAVPVLHDGEAHITINYYMGKVAEEAASYQAMGFFEGLLELARAKDIRAELREQSWKGDARTLLALHWITP
jgi:hypothetical protein